MKNTGQSINLSATIPYDLQGLRFDQAIAAIFPQFSRARLQSWIREEQVLLDGHPKRPRDRVQGGETIVITAQLADQTPNQPQAIHLNIVYEDEALLVINKPVGLVVHPAAGNPDLTLLNALLHHHPALAKLPRAGIVHRLDKNTSGLLVVAKTLEAHTDLVKQLQARSIEREYAAIVAGVLISGGTVDAPIGRHPTQRTHMAVRDSGKEAITHYRVTERFRAHSYLRVNLETGRTHQIRVHMAYIRHPILGDSTYHPRLHLPKGATAELIQTLRNFRHQALHAQRLALIHPLTGSLLEWTAPLPTDMEELLAVLRRDQQALLEDS